MPGVSLEVLLVWLGAWLVLLGWGYWVSAYAGSPVTVWIVLVGERAGEWIERVLRGLLLVSSYGFRITRIVVADAVASDQVIKVLERFQRRGYEFNYQRLELGGLGTGKMSRLAFLVTEESPVTLAGGTTNDENTRVMLGGWSGSDIKPSG
ncbi:MAG: hypothetical protein H5U02_09350 [Clostridia bacterium]|nr:hypothetical protein [Clostridia bacterium]